MVRSIPFIFCVIISCKKAPPTTISIVENTGTTTDIIYNLETCSTDISDDVPEFFKKYFHCVTAKMSVSGDYINLYYNGKPPYSSWYYPENNPNYIDWYSQGEGYYKIPNSTIKELDYVISIPINPSKIINHQIGANAVDGIIGTDAYEYPMGSVGCALNGVNIFNPLAAPGDVIEDETYTFDLYSAHPAGPSGIYHYHTSSPGPLEVLKYKYPSQITNTQPGNSEIELYGIMCDGTVVMGCKELDGSNPETDDWDAQNGHEHDLIDGSGAVFEGFANRYHTHICYNAITENDTDENGYEEHEFTPEASYYISVGVGNNNVCRVRNSPIESDR